MATRTSSALLPDVTTDARLRAIAGFMEDTLVTTGGWVYVAQAGDTAPAALVHSASANTSVGYRVYRMADALQATAPVYIKLEWGQGNNAAYPAFWLTIGTGADGNGVITGIRMARRQFNCTTANSTVLVNNSYGSADTSSVRIAMFIQGSVSYACYLSIERTRDVNGAETTQGLLMTWFSDSTSAQWGFATFINLADLNQFVCNSFTNPGAMPPMLSTNNPTAFQGRVGVAAALFAAGPVLPPGIGTLYIKSSDFTGEATFLSKLYNTNHTYLVLTSVNFMVHYNNASNITRDNTIVQCMRYE